MNREDLEQALISYGKSDYYPFHMPGHKRQKMGDYAPEEIDITEIGGFDNLHHAVGVIREGQERLAKLFGAAHSFYLVNGSTAGILAAVCASVRRGGRILMARNSHRAVYHGAYLMGLKTEYLYPQKTRFGIQGSICPGEVQKRLTDVPDVSAVILTSPTYDGVVSDVAAIAEIAHERGIPLIVDEAHGAHFGFSRAFPQKALAYGADLCVESLHKTLPSYTQTAALHVGEGARVDPERLCRYLAVFQSSSPSYVLMAGMDRCVRMLRQNGEAMFAAFERRLRRFYRACAVLGRVEVYPYDNTDGGIWQRDVSKILISAEKAGLHGQQLYDILLEKYHLQMEMAAGHYVTALTSVMDTDEGFSRLETALREIDARGSGTAPEPDSLLTPREIYRPREKQMEIYQALDAPHRRMRLEDSAGRISAEFICLYPPGIPLVAPGEVLTEELLETLALCRRRNMQVQGLSDMDAETILTAEPA